MAATISTEQTGLPGKNFEQKFQWKLHEDKNRSAKYNDGNRKLFTLSTGSLT